MLWVIYNPYYGLYNTSDEEWAQIAMAAGQLGFEQIIILAQVKGRIRRTIDNVFSRVSDPAAEASGGVML